jgi:hypothetical protein
MFKGYLPTIQLKRILPYLEELEASDKTAPRVLQLFAYRARKTQYEKRRPLPYVEVEVRTEKGGVIDYNYNRHGRINFQELKREVFEGEGFDELAVTKLVVALEKSECFDEEVVEREKKEHVRMFGKWSPRLAAIFERRFVGKGEEKKAEVIRRWTDEDWLRVGGKLSCLELVALQDQRAWARGDVRPESKYEQVFTDTKILRHVLWNIASGDFPHMGQYVLGKEDKWILKDIRPLKEW